MNGSQLSNYKMNVYTSICYMYMHIDQSACIKSVQSD